jgi:hypothetical protein
MTEYLIDFSAVRAELRTLNRGSLLIIAERAIELIPATQLNTLLSDFVQLTARPAEAGNATVSLLDEVRTFYDTAKAGKYYQPIEINNQGRQEQSNGTDAFIAEFHRLLHTCIRAADQEVPSGLRESFEFLLALLRHIDEGNDNVLFFADDGSSLDVGVNWRAALPAYFKCLAETSLPEEFARKVDEAIANFVDYDQPWYLNEARNVANDAQRIALDAPMTRRSIGP